MCTLSDFSDLISVGELSLFQTESQVTMSIIEIQPLTVDLPCVDEDDDSEEIYEEC